MSLDALPNTVVSVPYGSLARIDLYLRTQSNAALLRADVTNWDFEVFDEQGASPETPIYGELAKANTAANADTAIILIATTVAVVTGASRLALGHTFLHKFDPTVLFDAGAGRLYRIRYTFLLASSAGKLQASVPLLMGNEYL